MAESITESNKTYLRILSIVKDKINDARIYDAFLGDSYLYSYENGVMVIAVNSELAVTLLSNKYSMVFTDAVSDFLGQKNIKIKFAAAPTLSAPKKPEEVKPEFFTMSVVNPRLTFDNYVVGPNNKAASQAALLVAASPNKLYNPLFIYSNSGLGKTHLLFAIANYVREKEPHKKVLYCNAEEFMSEYISNIKNAEAGVQRLRNYIVSHDILLVDDIQQIAGREATEGYFFEIFERMYTLGKQIIITSDKHPDQLKNFPDRLKSRLQSGLTIEIEQPSQTTCVEIIKSKIKSSAINIDSFDPEVLEFIAEKFSKNIREIDGALNKITFYTTINPTSHVTMDVALDALQSLINVKEAKTALNEQKIIATVAEYYNLTISQLTGKGRPANVALPRHICWYLIKTTLNTPYTKIGLLFGGRDHSSVMSGVKNVENELKTNTLLENAINDIRKLLKQ